MKSKIQSALQTSRIGRARYTQKATSFEQWGYVGAHSGNNLGDDAMFAALRDDWKVRFPQRHLLSVELPWHERRLRRVGLSGSSYFKGAILGGGTLIGPFWEQQCRTLLDQGVPMWTFGTGAGSCGFVQPHQLNLSSWTPLLNDFVRVGVRGPLSLQKMRQIGVEKAHVVGDLALILARETAIEASPRPRVALNLSLPTQDEPNFDEDAKLREIESALLELKAKHWEIVPFAMNRVDPAPTRAALERMGLGDLDVPLLKTVDEFWELIGPCAFVVAVRLHAAILAACAGVPTLMLGYRDKCLDFMASMELEEWNIDLSTTPQGEMSEKILALSRQYAALRLPILERAQSWQTQLRNYSADIQVVARQ